MFRRKPMRQIDSIRSNSKSFQEAVEAAFREIKAATPEITSEKAAESLLKDGGMESLSDPFDISSATHTEAIILERLRPPYFFVCDEIEIKGDYDHVDLIKNNKKDLEKIALGVGRVDLFRHRSLQYAGTGWLVDKDIVVTNRHVARIFTQQEWDGSYGFAEGEFGNTIEARLDYVQQREECEKRRRADIVEVLYVAGDGEADIAFLRVEPADNTEPLELDTRRAKVGQPVGAVGYPASDGGRNDPALMDDLFGGVYEVKRFSPGLVTGHRYSNVVVQSDYTSLGGSSGGAILCLETGKVIALHFSGVFREANSAVAADVVACALARTRIAVSVPEMPSEAPTTRASDLNGRNGYEAEFLGEGEYTVPLPGLGAWSSDVAPVTDVADGVLTYRNFSVVQSASRRLPLLTAVNIDGARTYRLKRKGRWKLDGRVSQDHQIGNELYYRNPLDRGHMVRRRDPGWGDSREQAQQGEIDTFHYTNSVPQHEDLNQKDWVGLEDYVLDAAETRDFKVSVFTGPVFRKSDRELRSQSGAEDVKIPEEFWKVAVMVHADSGKLSATGYVLSHGPMIRDLTESAFVLGKYETYQVKISKIERETGLDFGRLRNFDPMGSDLGAEASFQEVVRRVQGPQDLLFQ